MHEIAICEGILGILREQAEARRFTLVKRVRVEVGPFSGVEVDALRFGFDVVTRGSLAAGATLDIVETAGAARCKECGAVVVISRRYDPCPRCGSHRMHLTAGEELRVLELEVD